MTVFPIYKKAYANKYPKTEIKKIKLCIQLTLLAILGSVLVIILDGIQSKWPSIIIDVMGLIAYFLTIYFLRIGRVEIGKVCLFMGTIILMFFNGSREGFAAGNQFIFLPLFAGTLLLFSRREWKSLLLVWVLAISCIIFLELTDYSYLIYSDLKPEWNYVNYLFCFTLSLVLICVFVLYHIRITNSSERRMKKLNTKLNINNKHLQKANTELDSFVYKASHDLRSPLTSLMGLIELIKNEKDPMVIRSYLLLEEKLVNKLDNYISEILDISRNSRLPLKKENIDIIPLLESIFIQLNFLENAERIKKEINVTGNEFYCDQMRLTIILNNLISNSIRYLDPNKKENSIRININITSSFAEIVIWDNGIGIKEEYINNLGKMFYRATESKSGSGLGLYLVKETIEKMNGSIFVKSEFNKWTEFTIKIPNNINEFELMDRKNYKVIS